MNDFILLPISENILILSNSEQRYFLYFPTKVCAIDSEGDSNSNVLNYTHHSFDVIIETPLTYDRDRGRDRTGFAKVSCFLKTNKSGIFSGISSYIQISKSSGVSFATKEKVHTKSNSGKMIGGGFFSNSLPAISAEPATQA